MKQLFINNVIFPGTEDEFLAVKNYSSKEWKLNGKWHRDDGPAIIYSNGAEYWYQNGIRHRTDGPARIWQGKTKFWYIENLDFQEFFDQFFPMINYIKDRYPGE